MSALYPPIARGATVSVNGTSGLLPAALIADRTRFYRGDGTFQTIAGGGDMLGANNLSDVVSVATSRTNLGLGTGNSPTFAGLSFPAATTTGTGINYGSDVEVYRGAAGMLRLNNIGGTNPQFLLMESNAAKAFFSSLNGGTYLGSSTANSLFLQTNSVTALTLDSSQNATFVGNVSLNAAGGQFIAGQSGHFAWSGRSDIKSPADGIIAITNSAATDFSRLQLGGTTSSFPSIKRSAATLAFRLADDSADAAISASAGTFSSAVNMATGQGVAWPAWQIYQTGSNFAVRDLTNSLNLMTYVGGTGVTGQATLLGNLIVSGTAASTFAGAVSVTGALSATTTVTDQSGVIGKRIADVITQNSHGFSVGHVLYNANGTWTKAKADALSTTYALGVVESVTTNTFVIVYQGPITLSSLTVSTLYYLSDATAGATTTTAPTTTTSFVLPVIRTGTSTQGYVTIGQPASLAKINLTTDITGILPTANGGTGIAYFTAAGPTAARVYTFPDAAATIARTDAANTFTGHQTIEGVTSTGATGTGKFVFDGTPTLVTPVLGVATATTINKWTFTAPTTACTITSGADNLTYTFPAITCNIGFREIPQNSQSAAYTTVSTDNGKHIYHPSADTTARNFTIDSNANVPYPIGTAITFINDTSAGTLTIKITTDTMVLFPGGSTGDRTLTAGNTATAIKVTSTRWVISGTSGLT